MKNVFISCVLICISVNLFSQNTGEHFLLQESMNGIKKYEASEYIDMIPAFNYEALNGPDEFEAKINPINVYPPSVGTTGGPGNENGTDGIVGNTEGIININDFGAATYTVPLKFPDDIAGMSPNLSLIYNSNGPDGILGPNWALGGLSVISCLPANRYYDGIHNAALKGDFAPESVEAFSLDGKRLVPVQGNQDNRIYSLENDEFIKVYKQPRTKERASGFYFIAKTKSGLTYYYGKDNNSCHRFLVPNTAYFETVSFYVNRIEDELGNAIIFTYDNDVNNGEIRISNIEYTSRTNRLGKYNIVFTYIPRIAPLKSYLSYPSESLETSVHFTTSKILTSIKCNYNNESVKNYILEYNELGPGNDNSCKIQHLNKIQEIGLNDGEKYNKLVFEWSEQMNYNNFNASSITLPKTHYLQYNNGLSVQLIKNLQLQFVDINNDSKNDIVRSYLVLHGDNPQFYHYNFNVTLVIEYLNRQADGSYVISSWFSYVIENNILAHITGPAYLPKYQLQFADYTGDGKIDILHILYKFNSVENSYNSTEVKLFTNIGDYNFNYNTNNIYNTERITDIYNGDFNGDGIADFVARERLFGGLTWRLGNPVNPLISNIDSKNGIIKVYNAQLPSSNELSTLATIDFNGDGRTDIIGGGSQVYFLEPESSSNNQMSFAWQTPNIPQESFLIKVNSDRKYDLLKILSTTEIDPISSSYANISVELKTKLGSGDVFLSNFDALQTFDFIEMLPNFTLLPYDNVLAGTSVFDTKMCDFNGDGLQDCLLTLKIVFSTYKEQNQAPDELLETIEVKRKFILYSTNNIKYYIRSLGEILNENSNILIEDLNSDRQSEVIERIINDDNDDTLNIYSPSKNIDKIISVTNSLGNKTKITYDFTSNNDLYTPGLVSNYPIILNNGNQILVSKIEEDDGNGGWLTEQYEYINARSHADGLGYFGFETIIKKDISRGLEYYNKFSINNDFYYVYPSVKYLKVLNGEIIEETQYDYKHRSFTHEYEDNGIKIQLGTTYFIQPKNIKTSYFDLENRTLYKVLETDFEDYDDYGNAKTITEYFSEYNENGAILKFQKETAHDYFENDNFQELGRLSKAITTVTSPDDAVPDIKEVQFEYYPVSSIWKGMLWKEKSIKPDNKTVTKEYIYDQYGNITSSTLSSAGLNSRKDSTVYTEDGRFIDTIINPIGHSMKRTYNSELGTLNEEYDLDNNLLISIKYYNAFGDLWKSIESTGVMNVSVFRWIQEGDNDAPSNSVYYQWCQKSGSSWEKNYFNNVGQELRNVKLGFMGEPIYVDTYYNAKGQIFKKSEPYFKGTQQYFTVYEYDELGRLSILSPPGINSTSYSYNCLNSTKIDPMGNTTSKKINVLGWITESTDENGKKVLHTYYNSGKTHTIKVDGNELSLREYKYDVNDNLKEYYDASQDTLKYDYNAFGELIKETNANGQETFYNGYDNLGRIHEIVTPEGITSYSYDLQKKGKLDYIDGPTEQIFYSYDNLLRTTDIEESIDNGSEDKYRISYSFDECSRIKNITYPTGYSIRNVYNQYGYQSKIIENVSNKVIWSAQKMNARQQYEEIKYGEKVSQFYNYFDNTGHVKSILSPNLQNNSYTWYDNGNIRTRQTLRGKKEEFLYDKLNRLIYVLYDDQQEYAYKYDDLGNLTYKSDVGTYSYNISGVDGSKPNAYELISIDNQPETINNSTQDIQFTSFNKVLKITETDPNTGIIVKQLDINYGINNQKVYQLYSDSSHVSISNLYTHDGLFEIEKNNTQIKYINYIYSPNGLFAVVKSSNDESVLSYVLNDYQGSIQIVSDEEGVLKDELSFDPWGLRRDPTTFEVYTSPTNNFLSHGFTGHEHIDYFLLVDMNGRIYDPVIGRFLSPDPFLQIPDYTQGLNPYSYVLNNPLNLTDPTGYSIEGQYIATALSLAAVCFFPGIVFLGPIVYTVTMTVDYTMEKGRGENSKDVFGYFINTFVTSSISMLGTKVIGGFFDELSKKSEFNLEFERAIAHGSFNGALRVTQGGKFEHGFLSGFASSVGSTWITTSGLNTNVLTSIVAASVLGGTVECIGGGKFANGAATGAYVMLLNHLSSGGPQKKLGQEIASRTTTASGVIIETGQFAVDQTKKTLVTLQTESDVAKTGLNFSREMKIVTKGGRYLKVAGIITGLVSYTLTEYEYSTGSISYLQRCVDHGVTTIGFVPLYGTILSFSYELGKDFGTYRR
jgi:RHS repeat-associated protein